MKRRLFFMIDKLEIKRSERVATSVLLILMVVLSGAAAISEPGSNYSEEQYEELEKLFKEKSEQIEENKNLIMARYEPSRNVPVSISVREGGNKKPNLPDTTVEKEEPKASAGMIDINTATNEQLQELPGVGPTYAGRIITWRQENGAFTSKDQLLEIKGIGEKRLAKIKPLITL